MGDRRKTRITLSGTRIYVRRKKYTYYAPEPMANPKTGKFASWHILCSVKEGEDKAREILRDLLGTKGSFKAQEGSFAAWFRQWRDKIMARRAVVAPTETERLKIWEHGGKNVLSVLATIEKAFSDFDLDEIRPADVAAFVDQWEGQRSAQIYRNQLVRFFGWCCRKALMSTNPAREVTVEKPPERDVYITDKQYRAIHAAAMVGNCGRENRTGPMLQSYMDLLYLLYQRGTDVRLLKWEDVTPAGILFKPTKTERSSGKKVLVPLTSQAREVLAKAKSIGFKNSRYVIHNLKGEPHTANSISILFRKACARAGVKKVTLRDIRAKAATDADKEGYTETQLQVALAHTDATTTRAYLKRRKVPVSEVKMTLPVATNEEGEEDES